MRALNDNLDQTQTWVVSPPRPPYGTGAVTTGREGYSLALDRAIRQVKKADWRGNRFKEREVRQAIRDVLGDDTLVDRIFAIVKAQREY